MSTPPTSMPYRQITRMLVNTTGHYATLNSYALRLAGIEDATKNPANGTIDRDAAGHVTGVLQRRRVDAGLCMVPKFTRTRLSRAS